MTEEFGREEVFATVLGMTKEAETETFDPENSNHGFQYRYTRLGYLDKRWLKTRKIKLEMLALLDALVNSLNK